MTVMSYKKNNKLKVLVVDDSESVHVLFERLWPEVEIISAYNGKEGLDKLNKAFFDVILCDYNMPEMTGLKMLEELSDDRKKGLFIAHSSCSTSNDLMKDYTEFIFKKGQDTKKIKELLEVVQYKLGSLKDSL